MIAVPARPALAQAVLLGHLGAQLWECCCIMPALITRQANLSDRIFHSHNCCVVTNCSVTSRTWKQFLQKQNTPTTCAEVTLCSAFLSLIVPSNMAITQRQQGADLASHQGTACLDIEEAVLQVARCPIPSQKIVPANGAELTTQAAMHISAAHWRPVKKT